MAILNNCPTKFMKFLPLPHAKQNELTLAHGSVITEAAVCP